MNKKKLYLIIQSVLCFAVTLFLAVTAVMIFREGSALKASDPLEWIYSREKVTSGLLRVFPLFIISVAVAAAGIVLYIRDDNYMKKGSSLSGSFKAAAENPGRIMTVRTVVLILAIVFIVIGIINGSAQDVFGKAVNICTECIGLG